MKNMLLLPLLLTHCILCHAALTEKEKSECNEARDAAFRVAKLRDSGMSQDQFIEWASKYKKNLSEGELADLHNLATEVYQNPGMTPEDYGFVNYSICAEPYNNKKRKAPNRCNEIATLTKNIARGRDANMSLEEVRKMISRDNSNIDMTIVKADISNSIFEWKGVTPDMVSKFWYAVCLKA